MWQKSQFHYICLIMTLNIVNCFLNEVHKCYFISKLIICKLVFSYLLLENVSSRFMKDLAIKTYLLVFYMVYSSDCLTLICINWIPGDPRTIFLMTSFTRKMPESSDSMHSSIFMLENI